MSYLVEFNDNTTETFTSVTKAYKAIEQFWQCGNSEDLKSVKKSLNLVGIKVVYHACSDKYRCIITKL